MFMFIFGCVFVGVWLQGGGCGGIPPCPACKNLTWWESRFKEPPASDYFEPHFCSDLSRASRLDRDSGDDLNVVS